MRKMLICLVLSFIAAFTTGAAEQSTLKAGFTMDLFSDVNEDDAVASIKVWADTILVRRGIAMESAPEVYPDGESLKKEVLAGSVDLISMLAKELIQIEDSIPLDNFHFTAQNGKVTEEYILLVQADSGIEKLADLQGKNLAYVDNARMALGWLWLDSLMIEAEIPDSFSSRTTHTKSSRAVMAAFFKKADVCLVSRKGYDTMVELNPQIGKRLRILKTSPEYIPAVLCMRKDYDAELKSEVLAALKELKKDIRGQQILTVFRADDIVPGTSEDLEPTRKLCERHAALRKQLERGKIQTAEVAK